MSAAAIEKYRIIAQIPSGYVLMEKDSNEVAVYKTVNSPLDYNSQRRLLRQRQSLQHPALLRLIDHAILESTAAGTRASLIYDGWNMDLEEDIYARQQSQTPFPAEFLQQLLISALQGLSLLHTADLVHGDIRPNNFAFNDEGALKFVDQFGFGDLYFKTRTQVFFERASYLAPEILEKCDALQSEFYATKANDIFAVGLVFLEAATLSSVKCLYDWERRKFDATELELFLSTVQQQLPGLYGEKFVRALQIMLEPNPSIRADVATVLELFSTAPASPDFPYQKIETQGQQSTACHQLSPVTQKLYRQDLSSYGTAIGQNQQQYQAQGNILIHDGDLNNKILCHNKDFLQAGNQGSSYTTDKFASTGVWFSQTAAFAPSCSSSSASQSQNTPQSTQRQEQERQQQKQQYQQPQPQLEQHKQTLREMLRLSSMLDKCLFETRTLLQSNSLPAAAADNVEEPQQATHKDHFPALQQQQQQQQQQKASNRPSAALNRPLLHLRLEALTQNTQVMTPVTPAERTIKPIQSQQQVSQQQNNPATCLTTNDESQWEDDKAAVLDCQAKNRFQTQTVQQYEQYASVSQADTEDLSYQNCKPSQSAANDFLRGEDKENKLYLNLDKTKDIKVLATKGTVDDTPVNAPPTARVCGWRCGFFGLDD